MIVVSDILNSVNGGTIKVIDGVLNGATYSGGGTFAVGAFPQVTISGQADLPGTLDLTDLASSGVLTAAGQTKQLMTYGNRSGAFGTVVGNNLGGGLALRPIYNATELIVEVGSDTGTGISPGTGSTGSTGGGSGTTGGVDVTFDDVTGGGVMSADYFQPLGQQELLDIIAGQVTDLNSFVLRMDPQFQVWQVEFSGIFDQADLVFAYDETLLPSGFDEDDLLMQHLVQGTGLVTPLQSLDTVNNTITVLDLQSFSPFILSAVPEPSTFVMGGVALLSLLLYGWRRRRNVQNH